MCARALAGTCCVVLCEHALQAVRHLTVSRFGLAFKGACYKARDTTMHARDS